MLDKEKFKEYANYSVRVDRFFHAVNGYAFNHENFKYMFFQLDEIYKLIKKEDIQIDKRVYDFIFTSYLSMQQVAQSNLFTDPDPCNLGDLPSDISIYSYISCYCYQWNLFEAFISYIMRELIHANVLKPDTKNAWLQLRFRTEKRFEFIDTQLFDKTPFMHLLPVRSHEGFSTREINYGDLDRIRKKRNEFVHVILDDSTDIKEICKFQNRYEEDMWILRLFAQNTFHSAGELFL